MQINPFQGLRSSGERGVGLVLVLVVIVGLAALAASMVRVGYSQQVANLQGAMAIKADHAAASGLDWALYKVLKDNTWKTCSGVSQTLDLSQETGAYVTVACNSVPYVEGLDAGNNPITVRVYNLTSTACTSSTGCPDSSATAAGLGYVERSKSAVYAAAI